jgi:hypothetical protein
MSSPDPNPWEDAVQEHPRRPLRPQTAFDHIAEDQVLLPDGDPKMANLTIGASSRTPMRVLMMRGLALLCACSLSIGSH